MIKHFNTQNLIPLIIVGLILISISPRFFIPLFIIIGIFYKPVSQLVKKIMDAQQNNKTIDYSQITKKPMKSIRNTIIAVVVALVVIILLVNMIIIIDAGETGVYHLFGKVRDKELSSGIHLINPLANITTMSIRTNEYTMSIAYGEGKRSQADEIQALTKEGLTVDLDITVLFHLNEDSASDVFRTVGLEYEEKIIRPEIRSVIREVVAQYEAKDIYSELRQEVAQNILTKLTENIKDRGIIMETVLLRNVNLPEQLTQSIEDKLTAEQEAQKYDFILEKEEKEAERKRIEARGQRDAQQIINESLTSRYLEYLYIQNLADREGTIYVPTSPSNGLPLFRNVP